MRGFSLVGILVAIAIMFYLFTMNGSQVAKTNATIKPQVQQLAGQNPDGTKAKDSAKFSPIEKNGALKGLKVDSIDPLGALYQYWKLQKGDEILEVGLFKVGTDQLDTFKDAIDIGVVEGMQRKYTMKVNRAGTIITLPQ